MTSPRRLRLRSSIAGAALGAGILFLVTALLAGSLAAVQANRTIDSLAHQLTGARTQIDELRKDNGRLDTQNQRLIVQNAEQHAQLDAVITYLRRHGFDVPKIIVPTLPPVPPTPGEEAGTKSPKAPQTGPSPKPSHRPTRSPATPAPTPTNTQPSPDPGLGILCQIAHLLCTP